MTKQFVKYLLFTVFILSLNSIQAQVLNISNEMMLYDRTERSAIKIMIAPEAKDVKKQFQDYMDDQHEVKVEGIGFLKNKDVLYTEEQVIAPITPQKMKLFAKIVESDEQTEFQLFGELENNIQITPHTTYAAYTGMKNMAVDFLNELLPDYYKEIVEDQKDIVEDLEDDKDDMRKKIAKNEKKIKELTEENEELEKKLAATENELKENMNKLGKKKENLKEVNQTLRKTSNQR